MFKKVRYRTDGIERRRLPGGVGAGIAQEIEERGGILEQRLEFGLDEGLDVVRRDAGRRPRPAALLEVGLAGVVG